MSGGTIPRIRYLDSYDHFTYDAVTISKMFDFVLIRGQKGIVNARTADLIVEGGSIFNQGLKLAQAKIGGTDLVHIGPSDWAADKRYAKEFAGTLSYNVSGGPSDEDQLLVVNKHGFTIDLLHTSDSGSFEGPINMNGYCIYNVGCIEMDLLHPPSDIGPSDLYSDAGRIVNLRNPKNDRDAVNKRYVDFIASDVEKTYVKKAGDTMTGPLIMDHTNISINSGNFETTDTNFISNSDTYSINNGTLTTTGTNFISNNDNYTFDDSTILNMSSNSDGQYNTGALIKNLRLPQDPADAVNKYYVDNIVSDVESKYVKKAGDTMTGNLTFSNNSGIIINSGGSFLQTDGNFTTNTVIFDSLSDTYNISDSYISYGSSDSGTSSDGTIVTNLRYPQHLADSANKNYVDTLFGTISGGVGAGLQVGLIMMWPTNSAPSTVRPSDTTYSPHGDSKYWLACDGSTFDPSRYPTLYAVLNNSNVLPDLNQRIPIGYSSTGSNVLTKSGPITGIPSSVETAHPQSIPIATEHLPIATIPISGTTNSVSVPVSGESVTINGTVHVDTQITPNSTVPTIKKVHGWYNPPLKNKDHTHEIYKTQSGNDIAIADQHNTLGNEINAISPNIPTTSDSTHYPYTPHISIDDVVDNIEVDLSNIQFNALNSVTNTLSGTVDPFNVDIPQLTVTGNTDPLGLGHKLPIPASNTNFSAQIPVIVMNFIIFASALPTTTP